MKYIIILMIVVGSFIQTKSQNYNDEKITLTNFIVRMYNNNNFEGVKILEDYNYKYILSVVSLTKSSYTSESAMSRVANVKANRQISTFLNGSIITSDLVITTNQSNIDSLKKVQIIETIKEQSTGFVNQLELLKTLDSENGLNTVYIFFKKI